MTLPSTRVVVLISGEGTNLQALIDAMQHRSLLADIVLVVSNRVTAPGLDRARSAGLATHIAARKRWAPGDPARLAYDIRLADTISNVRPDLLVFAGWMHVLADAFLERFQGRMMNIHPSLLPAFPGRSPIPDALAYGARVTGVTVHFVDPGAFDTGAIILQEAVEIDQDDTDETLLARLHAVEHRLYPRAVGLFLANRLVRQGRRVHIRGATD